MVNTAQIIVGEVFRSRQVIGTGNTPALLQRTFFHNCTVSAAAAATQQFSTLAADGTLPDNKVGKLRKLMMRHSSLQATVALAVNQELDVKAFLDAREVLDVELYIGDAKIGVWPLWALTAPSVWQGAAGTAAGSLAAADNGGWPLPILLDHDIGREAIRVQTVCRGLFTGPLAVAGSANFALEASILVDTWRQGHVVN